MSATGFACEQKILVTFYSDHETARLVANQMEIAATALVTPTKDTASELFRIGAEAVVIAAQIERDAADPPSPVPPT